MKRGREEDWTSLVDAVAADLSTSTERIPKGTSSLAERQQLLPFVITAEAIEYVKGCASDGLNASFAFTPQTSLHEGYHAQPETLRHTDIFSKNDTVNSKSAVVAKGKDISERQAVEIGAMVTPILQKASPSAQTPEMLRTEDLLFGTLQRLTCGIRRTLSCPRHFLPIIIVPSGVSSPIQIFNASEFLQEGVYLHPTKTYMNAVTGTTSRQSSKPDNVVVSPGPFFDKDRFKGVAFRKFLVVDDPKDVPNWDHVCACIVNGVSWQFDNWFPAAPRNRDPSLLFSLMRGFLTYFEEDKVPAAVAKWKVQPLVLNRKYVKANAHIAQAFTFWEELYHFLSTNERFCSHVAPAEDEEN